MSINQYRETALHLALKRYFAEDDGQMEQAVDGYIVDVVRDDLLIEIQTRHFSALKKKLFVLAESHRVLLAHPIALERWLVRLDASGKQISRRKSPKRGHITHLFSELVYLPDLLAHGQISLGVVMIRDEEIRVDDGKGSWRRGGVSIQDRRLLAIERVEMFATMDDLRRTLPDGLPPMFTTRDLAESLQQPIRVAQKMAYCLREGGLIAPVGKRGQAYLYALSS